MIETVHILALSGSVGLIWMVFIGIDGVPRSNQVGRIA